MIIQEINRDNKIDGFDYLSDCLSIVVSCCDKTEEIKISGQPERVEKANNNHLVIACSKCNTIKHVPYYIVQQVRFPLDQVGNYFRTKAMA